MFEEAIHERLRRTRIERGESRASLATRAGIRAQWLQAIEDGRFQDLPTGIYARAAIRRHAEALGLQPEGILLHCAPLLREIQDPIGAIARLRGIDVSWTKKPSVASSPGATTLPSGSASDKPAPIMMLPSWRLVLAAVIDAAAMGALLLVVVTCTVAAGIPVTALRSGSAIAFTTIALVLSACYFGVLGGIVGETAGEHLACVRSGSAEPSPLDLRAMALRTFDSVFRDALFIELLGKWMGGLLADHKWPAGVNGSRHAEHTAG